MIKRLVCIFIILCMLAGHRTSNVFMNDLAIDAGLNHPRVVQFDDKLEQTEGGYDTAGGLTV